MLSKILQNRSAQRMKKIKNYQIRNGKSILLKQIKTPLKVLYLQWTEKKAIGMLGYLMESVSPHPSLVGLFVHPSYRKQGIAKCLVQKLVASLQENSSYTHVHISANASLSHVVKLYTALGFSKTEIETCDDGRCGGTILHLEKTLHP